MCSAFSFSCNTMFLYTICERSENLFSCLPLFFSPACVFFSPLYTQFTEAMEWLPGSQGFALQLQVRRPGVAELSVAVEGDSPWWNINMSPYWFTALWPNMIQYWETGECLCLFLCNFLPCDDKKHDDDKKYYRFPLHYKKGNYYLVFCRSKAENSSYTKNKLEKRVGSFQAGQQIT